MITDHTFRPYADHPELCVEELPATGDTCNRDISQHETGDTNMTQTAGTTVYTLNRNEDANGNPVGQCDCREYTPAITAVTLVWEESTSLTRTNDWTSGEVTTYTVRMYNSPHHEDDDEIDCDGFRADEADETDQQPYLDAENRLLARYGLSRQSITEIITPF